MELGIIPLYNEVINTAQTELDVKLSERIIDDVILSENTGLETEITNFILHTARSYANDLIMQFRELGIDLRIYHPIFVGGGSLLLKDFLIENCCQAAVVEIYRPTPWVTKSSILTAYGCEVTLMSQIKRNPERFSLQFNLGDPRQLQ